MTSPLPLLPLVLANTPASLRVALQQEGVPHVLHGEVGAAGRFVLFDSRSGRAPALEQGQTGIDVAPLRSDGDGDPFAALTDESAAVHRWTLGTLELREEIARVDRRAVRQRLLFQLRRMIERQGGVWLRVAAYPFPYKSAFNFRVDHDDYIPSDFDVTLTVAEKAPGAFSHYICASSFEGQKSALARLRGMDVGAHGYWHHTYRNRIDNLFNIRRSIATLEAAGIQPSGFVAPHGRFNRHLLRVLAQLGVGFSSEFALAYDDLPFFPRGKNVLQIPVHPVCLGLFLDAARRNLSSDASDHERTAAAESAVDAAVEYFRDVSLAKYALGEPIFLYCHPDGRLGRYPRVLHETLNTVSGFAACWQTTYTEFAAWWRQRIAARLQLWRERDFFVLNAQGLPPSYTLAVEYWRENHVARFPVRQPTVVFSHEALVYETPRPAAYAKPQRVNRPPRLVDRLRRTIDWEKTTPISEIRDPSWRGWTKWVLRHVRQLNPSLKIAG